MVEMELIRIRSLKTGLSLNYISKEEKISLLLEKLSEIFGSELILKGGTAINRIYLQKNNVARFSEDIDLDFVSRASIAKKIHQIKEGVSSIKDFEIDKGRQMHNTIRYDCSYLNEIGAKDKVRIEFYLSHPTLLAFKKPEKQLIKSSFIDSASCLFNVYSLEDLIARKLVALYNRGEGKDIYDVSYCLDLNFSRGSLNAALLMMLKFYHIKLSIPVFFEELIKRVESFRKNSYYIGNSTNHYLPADLRPNWDIFIATLNEKIRQKLIKGRIRQ